MGDLLMSEMAREKESATPEDFERWKAAAAPVMGAIYDEMIQPISTEHPQIIPKAMGGTAEEE